MNLLLLILVAAAYPIRADSLFDVTVWSALPTFGKSGDDGLEALLSLTANTRKMLKLGQPIGALIAKGLEKEFAPNSNDQRAIIDLNHAIEKRLKTLNTQYTERNGYSRSSVDAQYEFSPDYYKNVSQYLFRMERLTQQVTSANFSSRRADNEYKIPFGKTCSPESEQSPFKALDFMQKVFRENCELPTEKSVQRYNWLMEAFQTLEKRGQQITPHYVNIKTSIMSHINVLTDEELKKVIEITERINIRQHESYPVSLVELDTESGRHFDSHPAGSICLIDYKIIGNALSRAALTRTNVTLAGIALDLQHVMIFTSACANSMTGGNTHAVEKLMNRTAEIIESIGDFAEKWVRSLEKFYPSLSAPIVKRALSSASDKIIEVTSYNETAKYILDQFNANGTERGGHQVVVAETKDVNVFWATHTIEKSSYVNITALRGIDAHIFQYGMENSNRSVKAQGWLDGKKVAILQIFKDQKNHQKSASELLNIINETVGPLCSGDGFRSVLLFRNKAVFEKSSLINVGESAGTRRNFTDLNKVEHFEKNLLGCDYAWKMFFFL